MNLRITAESALAILGATPDEARTPEGINAAFRRAALFVHPDKHGNDEEATRLFRLMIFCRDGLLKGMHAPPPPPPPPQPQYWVRVDLGKRGWWTQTSADNTSSAF